MKKIKALFVISILFVSVVNAQYFVGGTLGYNSFGYKYENTKTNKDYPSYMVSPLFGYRYNENLSFGVMVKYSANNSSIKNLETDINTKEKFTLTEFGGFARYTILTLKEFRICAQGNLTVGTGGYKTITDGKKEKGKSISTLNLSFKPYFTYSISDQFNIEASLNMMDFGVLLLNTKPAKQSTNDEIEKHHHFYWADSGCGHIPYNSLVSLGLTYNIVSRKVK